MAIHRFSLFPAKPTAAGVNRAVVLLDMAPDIYTVSLRTRRVERTTIWSGWNAWSATAYDQPNSIGWMNNFLAAPWDGAAPRNPVTLGVLRETGGKGVYPSAKAAYDAFPKNCQLIVPSNGNLPLVTMMFWLLTDWRGDAGEMHVTLTPIA